MAGCGSDKLDSTLMPGQPQAFRPYISLSYWVCYLLLVEIIFNRFIHINGGFNAFNTHTQPASRTKDLYP